MVVVIVIVAIIVILLIWFFTSYNSLVRLNQQSDEAWSDITVQLKRRYDLIPNLVNSVKGYAAHESEVFEKVTEARSQAMSAQGVADTAKAENQIQATLKSLFAVAESYPQLRATENFQQLSGELTDTEDKIQASRRFYNGVVRDFNTKRNTVPTKFIASLLGYKTDKEYFELEGAEAAEVQQAPNVQF